MSAGAAFGISFKPLIGTDEATVDDKGRILVSKKKRDRLGEKFVLALAPTKCLVAYPESVWDRIVEEIFSHDQMNSGTEQYTRLMLGNADDDIKFDGQGRFVVPQRLREEAGLRDKVVLVGCGNRMEIWDKGAHDEFYKQFGTDADGRREAIEKAYRQMKEQ